MKKFFHIFLTTCILVSIFSLSKGQVYLDPNAPVEDRVNDLLPKMTQAEKLSYIGGLNSFYIRGISRLKIPEIKMSDGPVGVRTWGKTTAYPAGILTASTWDETLVYRLGQALGKDARSRGVHILLAPGLNIHRAPMCGRNFEYFGEDPYLSSRMAVGYIEGVQSERVVCTAKHYAANNQEWDRYGVSSDVDERTLEEIYLPAFKAAVTEAKAGCVMSSYNLVNGTWASENPHLLTEVLKENWKFKGFVMSDWGATHNGKNSALAGLDLEMPAGDNMNSNNLLPLINNGTIPQSVIDDKVARILRVLFTFGFFDKPQTDASIPADYPANAQVALDLARSGIVLLKNENSVLPLDKSSVKSIAVIGKNADAWVTGGGSSYTDPFHYVSVLNGITAAAGNGITVTFDAGNGEDASSYQNSIFYTNSTLATRGLTAEYFANKTLTGTATKTQVDKQVNFAWGAAAPAVAGIPADNFSVRWSGVIKVPVTGDYTFFVRSDDGSRLWVNNTQVVNQWNDQAATTKQGVITLTKDVIYPIKLEYYESAGDAEIKMGYSQMGLAQSSAVLAAKNADVAVVCVGFDSSNEGEGSDRTFALPAGQDSLINSIARVNSRTIVILNAGGNVATQSWIGNVKGLLHAWYPGQEGGTAIGEILFGITNPSGKLPVSFEKKWEDNPTYKSYYDINGNKRVAYTEGLMLGYRYYDTKNVEPLFPFGYGLSYTSFSYGDMKISHENTNGFNTVLVSFNVTNSGKVSGAEVAQVYVSQPGAQVVRPEKELKGFAKVFLTAGETKNLTIKLDSAAFSYFKENKKAFGYDPGNFDIKVGGSSRNIQLTSSVVVTAKDTINPEIKSFLPAKNSSDAKATNTFSVTFSEPVYYNYIKAIRIKEYLTDNLIETINTKTIKGMGTNTLTFSNNVQLKNGVRYYLEMDQSSVLDYSDNSFAGISDKETWNFSVTITALQSLEDQQTALVLYPNPSSGQTTLENLPDQPMKSELEILDVIGRKVQIYQLSSHQTQFEFDCSALKPGIYMVQVSTPEGKLVKKLVKE